MTLLVNASDFAKNFGRYRDRAAAERVVEVSSNGRPIGAFLSQPEYERYLEMRRRAARAYRMDELPDGVREDLQRGLAETGKILKSGRYKGPKK
jgi:hypothetical protein